MVTISERLKAWKDRLLARTPKPKEESFPMGPEMIKALEQYKLELLPFTKFGLHSSFALQDVAARNRRNLIRAKEIDRQNWLAKEALNH